MGSWAILFFRSLFEKQEEDQKKEKPETWRQSLTKLLALMIIAFIGLMFLTVMDQFIAVLSKLIGS